MIYKNFSKNKSSLLSGDIKDFGRRRFVDFLYFALILLSVSIFLALVSQGKTTASWNFVTNFPLDNKNLMGDFGAKIADVLSQFLSVTSYGIPILLMVWGAYGLLNQPRSHMKVRFLCAPFAVIIMSVGLSGISESIGGVLGTIVQRGILTPVYQLGVPKVILSLTVFISGTALYFKLLGVPWALWKKGFLLCGNLMDKAWNMAVAFSRSHAPKKEAMQVRPLDKLVDTAHEEERDEVEEKELDPEPLPFKIQEPLKKKVPSLKPAFVPPLSREGYTFPSLDLLQKEGDGGHEQVSRDTLKENAERLKSILEDFGVHGEIANVYPGPVVTLYEFKPAPGVKSARVISLADDIARSTSSVSTRISVMPGVNALGIEIPNPKKETVYMRSLLEEEQFRNPGHKLPLALGKNISGDPVIGDLGRMPHLLIAGTTGSGKSVSINTMILSLLYRLTPDECKFIMIDPKMLELSIYDGIPHLLTPVVTDPHKAVMALKWTVREMESRYQVMSKLAVRNVEGYNKKIEEARDSGKKIMDRVQTGFDAETGQPTFEEREIELKTLPFIVVIVDEMADLMLVAGKDIEMAVQRLAQMARAAGIHLIMATQRPSVDVITGTIKANFPTRISFHVTSRIDSRTILGEQGAEQLLGQGDMLYMKPGGRVLRVHGPFVSDKEVESIVQFLRSQGAPVYEESIEQEESGGPFSLDGENSSGDELYDQALSIILREQKASTSFIQRHLQIGYNRAARIIEKMEDEGVVSKPNHVGKREILMNQ